MGNIAEATSVLIEALKSDPSFYYSWQANIAMAFQDEFSKNVKDGKFYPHDIHMVANKAAKNFLNLFIGN